MASLYGEQVVYWATVPEEALQTGVTIAAITGAEDPSCLLYTSGYQDDMERRFARRGEMGKGRLWQWFTENPLAFVASHLLYKPLALTVSHLRTVDLMSDRLKMCIRDRVGVCREPWAAACA